MPCDYAFLELGVNDGVIVARTDSLGAGLTQKIPVSQKPGNPADQYNAFLQLQKVSDLSGIQQGDQVVTQGGKAYKPVRLPMVFMRLKTARAKTAACLIALRRFKTAPTCCGLKPSVRMSGKSAAWSAAFAKCSRCQAGL